MCGPPYDSEAIVCVCTSFIFLVAQTVKNLPARQETPVQFLGWQDLLEKEQATHSSILGLPQWLRRWRISLQCGRPRFDPWVGKIPWRREQLPIPIFLPGEFHRQRSLSMGSDTTEQLSLHFILSRFSRVQLFVTLWIVACQAPLSMGFFRKEYSSGLPFPPPEDLPNPGTEPASLSSPALPGRFFTTSAT